MKSRSIVWSLLLLMLVTTCGGQNAPAGGEIKLVIIAPLTGASGFDGKHAAEGAQVAIAVINAQGGILGKKVSFVLEDDASDKAQTATLMNKYGPDQSVLAIIGPSFSSDFVATAPLADQFKVPYVSSGSTAPWQGDFNDWTFRVSLAGTALLPPLVKAIADKVHPKTAAQITAITNLSFTTQAALLDKIFAENGIKVTTDEAARDNDTEFRAQITKIMQNPPDLIAIGETVNDASLFMQQARQAGYKGLFIGNGSGLVDPTVYTLSRGAADGLIVASSFFAGDPSPLVQDYGKVFRDQMKREPGSLDAFGYDAVGLIADAIKRANTTTDRAKVRDALGKTSKYQGVSGLYSFNGKGDNTTPTPEVLVLTADGFKLYK